MRTPHVSVVSCSGTRVTENAEPLEESIVLTYTAQIAMAMQYIHRPLAWQLALVVDFVWREVAI